MLEITIDNCYKCDLETINDVNSSQYFRINRRDLIETKRNWQVILDKYKDLLTQKYRRELTPNITFQPKLIFKESHKLIATDLSKQTKLKDPQQINFIRKIDKDNGATMFFIIAKSEETFYKNLPQLYK